LRLPSPSEGTRLRTSLERSLALLAVVAAVGVTYWRLFYGVDFTDESFYVVVPLRLVLGARPYVDDTDVQQLNAAILVYPFVRAYHAFVGLGGIVLFMRHLWFLFTLGVAASVFAAVRTLVGSSKALVIGSTVVLFAPFAIRNLSYNTLGSGLFTAGCLLSFLWVRRGRAFLAAVALALAAFAYLPLLVGVAIVCVAGYFFVGRSGRTRWVAASAVALGLPLAAMGVLALDAGVHTVVADYRHSATYFGQGGGPHKLVEIAAYEGRGWLFGPAVIAAFALLVVAWRSPRVPAVVPVAMLPLFALPAGPGYLGSLKYAAHLGWLAPPLLAFVHARPEARRLFLCVWVPALAGGLLTSYASTNGGTNFGLGFLPATIVSLVFLVWAAAGPAAAEQARFGLGGLAPLLVVVAGFALFQATSVYRDGPVSALTARVAHGPFAGLLTTSRKRAYLLGLERLLAGIPSRCRIVFFNDFPAGYLLTRAHSDANTAWIVTVAPRRVGPYHEDLLRYYRRVGFPDLAVVMDRIPYTVDSARVEHYAQNDPLLRMLRADRYRLVRSTAGYRIFSRRPPACTV
jgi:hypothetical protein